jgi:hypothetical protein
MKLRNAENQASKIVKTSHNLPKQPQSQIALTKKENANLELECRPVELQIYA